MSLMVLDGVTIPVSPESGSLAYEEVGSQGRGFDGEYHHRASATKRRWTVRTAPSTHATCNTIRAKGTAGAVTASGTFCEPDTSISVIVEVGGTTQIPVAGGFREQVELVITEV